MKRPAVAHSELMLVAKSYTFCDKCLPFLSTLFRKKKKERKGAKPGNCTPDTRHVLYVNASSLPHCLSDFHIN